MSDCELMIKTLSSCWNPPLCLSASPSFLLLKVQCVTQQNELVRWLFGIKSCWQMEIYKRGAHVQTRSLLQLKITQGGKCQGLFIQELNLLSVQFRGADTWIFFLFFSQDGRFKRFRLWLWKCFHSKLKVILQYDIFWLLKMTCLTIGIHSNLSQCQHLYTSDVCTFFSSVCNRFVCINHSVCHVNHMGWANIQLFN